MGDNRRDDSVSPLTRSPKPTRVAIAASPDRPASPLPSILKSSPLAGSPNNVESTTEARDYMNGGLPHRHQSPVDPLGRPIPPALYVPSTLNNSSDANDRTPDPPFLHENGGNSEPTSPGGGRRSVQFARADVVLDAPPAHTHSRNTSWDDPAKSLSSSLMNKLKQFAGSSTQIPKSPSSGALGEAGNQALNASPTVTRGGSRIPGTLAEEGSDIDADAEETADEGVVSDTSRAKKKKRMMRRPRKPPISIPSTPNMRVAASDSPVVQSRLGLRRRLSMPDPPDHQHGLSEGEGRDQLTTPSWMRGNSWIVGSTRSLRNESRDTGGPSTRGPGHVRRITVLGGGGASDGDAMTPRRPFFSGERASTFGVQKWKQVKNTLKLLRQKKEDRFDFAKSAELMAELRAGAPAALMLASMIQRDEHGNKRIPVLLEQVRLHIRDSAPEPGDDSDRHWLFTIDMEYGSGPSRMKWTIIRTIKDVYNLHVRYKFAMSNDKFIHGRADIGSRPKQPKFPWAAFPYLRGARTKDESEEDDMASVRGDDPADQTPGERTVDETADETDGRPQGGRRKKSRLGMLGMRRRSTGLTDPGETSALEGHAEMMQSRRRYVERQRRVLEKYMQDMVRWLMFRADSNRLCKFLELSALGVRLAAEGSYHGKECYLHIQSSKGLDFRRVLTPEKVIARHSRKWFLVRSSYIVCVESPENMLVYDVYLVDAKFRIASKKSSLKHIGSSGTREIDLTKEPPPDKHHTLTLHTSERKVKLFSRNQAVLKQFEDSIAEMLKQTKWHSVNRFDSFAPVRQGVFAQWLVDGRDYMWNVSRAISMARDVIYIHDWWLSPELYMRRPPAISQKWRLDRLLQRKAREGVKVFVIVYRNVEAAIPIDSEYTKHSLLNLHPNIFVQRSPNQFKKNQFFFAHHEKLCVIDHDIAFVGGIDLCFGRWDCPQHPCVDDKPTGFEQSEQPKDALHCQLFPGKDYSNARVQDFYKLNEPYEEMYDRGKIPRMPWHDIGMQVVGQPARDLTRHFVQRWNYIRRGRTTTRPLPFLLPPPDVKPGEMEGLGLTGTCEVQVLRSACNWSLGIDDPEHSIQNAYIKMIEDSDHFAIMSNIDDELLALAGGNDSSDEEEVMSDRDSRADSASPPPSKKAGSGAKRGARGRGDDDSDAEEGEAFSPPGSPKSDGSAAMDESDSEAEGSADPDDEDKYPVDGMFRSAAEKKHVMGMREVERESLLADRQAEIERQQQNRMLRQLVAKQENEEKKNKVKKRTADAADLDDDDDAHKSARQRTETSKTGAAIDSLRRARAEKNDRARAREENRRTGRDSPHRDRRHSSSRSRSRDSYDGGRRRSFSQDRHSPPRELPPATIRDFERIRVGRSRFAQYCFNPGFEDAITGCYVRVSLGPDPKTGQDDYRLAKIKGIAVGKPYALNGPSGSFVTDQYVIAAHGKAEKEFAFIFCSDKPVTEREFNRYVTTLQVDGMAFPKTQVLLNKVDDINKFVERSLTSAEIDEKVARKNELRKKFDPERRDRLRWEIEEATAAARRHQPRAAAAERGQRRQGAAQGEARGAQEGGGH
ncbi:hypothetical protein BN1708_002679 [Verticillium longisporum]|uniref:phospholipase D n=1 Tax=Verticillium longisporum TaxID=100787 RepID=A0A0G4KXB8_VERLO|nr:hypothetical protein BN1708_002679 [Verticillium longisporum]